jgi:hypothetical protein
MESQPSQPTPLNPGAYSIPVKIQGGVVKDPTLSGYETPSFIHKKETISNNNHSQSTNPEVNMKDSMEKDIQAFISQFDNAKDKKDRVEICIYY